MPSSQVIKNRLDQCIRSEIGVDHPALKEGGGHRWPLDLFQPHDLVSFFFFWIQGIYLTNPAVFKLRRNVIVFCIEIKFRLMLWHSQM